ncbi:MAG: ATP-binding cassette domain-containing protein [Desulfomicrobium sp.]|uniref:type I secretion system permease/ATPase n=1 Tax=Hoeflea sp. TaxID=1940281 RepID=UPI0025BBFBDF|nr:ATP-binding cassette domain-containing protein [Hoeflea sp.]MBU4532002.1 ATP-binding cassette domain-containing protein [Alphaproteobacteria bacterium]MBV1712055.1 ATP-binding cassette domain-containing protein [Desulfomicrobium sp.]MBV1782219.1 ATP-binding cassette domain-containing protein [Hoeflea sp.]
MSVIPSHTKRIRYNYLTGFLRRSGWKHTQSLLAYSVLVNFSILAPSFHMMQVYDRVLSSGSIGTLVAISGIVLFVLCIYVVGETVRGRVAQRLAAVYAVSVSRKLFARLGEPAASNSASTYIRDFGLARQFLASRIFVGLFDLPFIPFYLVLLFFVHPTICLLTIGGLAAMATTGYFNFKLTAAGRETSRKAEAEAAGFAQSAFARSGEVRALGMVPNLLNTWGKKMSQALSTADEATAVSSTLYSVSKGIRQSIQVVTMAWGAYLVLQGDMSGGLIFLASMISGRALAPLEQVIGGWENIVHSVEALNNVEELTGPDKKLQKRPDLPAPKGNLEARDIEFSDFGKRPILTNAAFRIKSGEAVLIGGAPGAGKSIFVAILAGARVPEAGFVALDGAPRERWPQAQWGKSIGYCGEEAGLLTGSISQNICRFDPMGDLQEVYRVSKGLGLHDLVMDFPQGYQTIITNSSDFLPASARKLIALARALYGRPRIILLDQPTIFLDQKTEGALLNLLSEAKKDGSAIVLVTRSPMLIRMVSRAVKIEDKEIVPSALPQKGSVMKDPYRRNDFHHTQDHDVELAS